MTTTFDLGWSETYLLSRSTNLNTLIEPHTLYHDTTWTGHGSTIYVLDTGVNAAHPFFSNHPVTGDEDDDGHGTFLAGLIYQISPDADIVSFRILDSNGTDATTEEILDGLKRVEMHAHEHNVTTPIVLFTPEGYCRDVSACRDDLLVQAMEALPWVFVVPASSNTCTVRGMTPASSLNAITVSTLNSLWESSTLENEMVDLWAPSHGWLGPWLDEDMASMSSASTSAAVVAALAAQVLDRDRNLKLTSPTQHVLHHLITGEGKRIATPPKPGHRAVAPWDRRTPPTVKPTLSCRYPLAIERWTRNTELSQVRAQVTQPGYLTLESKLDVSCGAFQHQTLCLQADVAIFHVAVCLDPLYARTLWDVPNPKWSDHANALQKVRQQTTARIYLPACNRWLDAYNEYVALQWNVTGAKWDCVDKLTIPDTPFEVTDCSISDAAFSLFATHKSFYERVLGVAEPPNIPHVSYDDDDF